MFDDKTYWKKLHQDRPGSILAVGHTDFSEVANGYFYRARFDILDRVFVKCSLSGKTVLDAGCGNGIFTKYYVDKNANVTCVDISPNAIDHIRKTYPSVEVHIGALRDLQLTDDSFDVIHCFDVLYHIIDDKEWEESFNSLAKMLKPGGLWLFLDYFKKKEYAPGMVVKHRAKNAYLTLIRRNRLKITAVFPIFLFLQKSRLISIKAPALAYHAERLLRLPFLRPCSLANVVVLTKIG